MVVTSIVAVNFVCVGCGNREPATPPSPGFSGAFVDETSAIEPLPFALHPGDGVVTEPEHVIGLFADLDGDDRDELIVSPTRIENGAFANRRAFVWRATVTGGWERVGPVFSSGDGIVSGANDLDGDGAVDLIVVSEALQIAWGHGDGRFDPPVAIGDYKPRGQFAPHGIALDDVDDDGWTDLVVNNRYCRPDTPMAFVYLHEGPRSFRATPELFEPLPGQSSYSIMTLRASQNRRWVVTLGQTCTEQQTPTFLLRTDGPNGYPLYKDRDPVPDDTVYNARRLTPRRTSEFAPMAACAGDLDGDDSADVYLSLDPFQVFLLTANARFTDVSETTQMSLSPSATGANMIPWGAALIDLDRDLSNDFIVTHGNDPGEWQTHARNIGAQTVTAAINNGTTTFTDVSERLGLARPGQWRALTLGDPDRDGDPDLIVGGQGEAPRLYRNHITTPRGALSVRLVGTTSGSAATGAMVTAVVGTRRLRAWVGAMASSDVIPGSIAFLSTGTAPRLDQLLIDWPSGTRQILHDVSANSSLRVVEPVVLEVSPPERTTSVSSPFELTVTPRADDGSARTAAVTARVFAGACTLSPPTQASTAWRFTARAPGSSPAWCVIEFSVSGHSFAIRPRLRWN